LNLLSNQYARVLTLLLLAQGAVFYAVAMRPEKIGPVGPLDQFPRQVPGWTMYQESKVEPEVQDVLKADDLLSRMYVNDRRNQGAYLFIAFFKTQREGQSPHSPKNCLPGSGFEPIEPPRQVPIQVAGRDEPIQVNHYLTARGEEKSVTLYWYQSHRRIIADEFAAKFWLIADSIRYHRSDTALVRIVVQVRDNNTAAATQTAVEFAQSVFPAIAHQLPL
jgi:EpsI family protein